jgi:hypothetical protein
MQENSDGNKTMPLVLRYFWFLSAAFMLVFIVGLQRRLLAVVDRGIATKPEIDQFIRWVSLWLVGGSVLFGLIGLAAKWPSPFCIGMLSFVDVPRTLVSLVVLSLYVAPLWWVWRGNGADFLARVGPALSERPSYDRAYSPAFVRTLVTVLVLGGGSHFYDHVAYYAPAGRPGLPGFYVLGQP